MTLPVETADVAERGRAFLSILGSFWTSIHKDKELWQRYSRGLGELLGQRLRDYAYLLDTLTRHEMPVSRRRAWRRIRVLESGLATSNAGALKYGEGVVFGLNDGAVELYVYGGRSSRPVKQMDLPSTLVHAAALVDSPLAPNACLVANTDFWIEPAALVFRRDPFTDPRLPVVNIYDSLGNLSDRELTLWAFDSHEDLRDMSEHFGVVVGLEAASSEGYSKLVNAALDILVDGPSLTLFRNMLAAWAGEKPVAADGEVVVEMVKTAGQWVVATDTGVYTFAETATPVVAVGDVLSRGDFVSDTIAILATAQELEALDGLMLDARWYPPLGRRSLAFPNDDRPVRIATAEGKTRVSVELQGAEVDARRFWDAVHRRGVDGGTTLAHTLDLRDEPSGEPTVAHLPKTVNPLRLLLSEMGSAMLVVRLKPEQFTGSAPEVPLGTLLRRLVPTRYTTLLLIERSVETDYIDLSVGVSETSPGADDEVTAGIAVEAFSEVLPVLESADPEQPGLVDGGLIAWITGDPCPAG